MIRYVLDKDLPELRSWFDSHWGQAPEQLPKLGVIACEDTRGTVYNDKLAGWIYHDPSCGVGWIGWVVANPDNTATESARYMRHLLDGLEVVAKNNQIKTLLYTTEKKSMMSLLEKQGYVAGDSGVTHMIKQI